MLDREEKGLLRKARAEAAVDYTSSAGWAAAEPRVGARWKTPDLGRNSKEFIAISEATRRLMAGMFGALPQTPGVKSWKEAAPPALRHQTYSTPRRKEAGHRIAEAVRSGEMSVYVVGSENISGPVSLEFLRNLILSRGEIPN